MGRALPGNKSNLNSISRFSYICNPLTGTVKSRISWLYQTDLSLTDTPFSPIPWSAAVKYLPVLKSRPSAADSIFVQSLGTTWTSLQAGVLCPWPNLFPRHCYSMGMGTHLLPHTLRAAEHLLLRLHATEHHSTSQQGSAGTLLPGHRSAVCHDLLSLTSPKSRGMSKHGCSVHE